jgi:undecaprenyl-diphosphatase
MEMVATAAARSGLTSRGWVNPALLGIAMACALAVIGFSAYVARNPHIPADAAVARAIQEMDWGPLAYAFPFFSWIGGEPGFMLEIAIFFVVLAVNRRTWMIAAAGVASGAWYQILSHLIVRPRPAVPDVLRVTEHPGASSYPSGHTIFMVTVLVVLTLCFGYPLLPRAARYAGWVVIVILVTANAISRVYTGAHWPTDVVAGILIAAGWMSLVLSPRWVSDRVFRPQPSHAGAPASAR